MLADCWGAALRQRQQTGGAPPQAVLANCRGARACVRAAGRPWWAVGRAVLEQERQLVMAYQSWHTSHGISVMAYQLWHISHGISVMAYQSWHISYGVLVMAQRGRACRFGAGAAAPFARRRQGVGCQGMVLRYVRCPYLLSHGLYSYATYSHGLYIGQNRDGLDSYGLYNDGCGAGAREIPRDVRCCQL